jgi:hypothetical protein
MNIFYYDISFIMIYLLKLNSDVFYEVQIILEYVSIMKSQTLGK